ncbi:MAG: dTDP-4-dehydrorhamnose 3,5-epimerase family protein [Patescibacteria group bacterium]|jgi:dTDP-4-dehydrorhamnose 3,5-epimerase
MIAGVVIKKLKKHSDERGYLMEIFRHDELDLAVAMAYLSLTLPGVKRGPHEHVYQSDYFIFPGPGEFKLVLWDRRPESKTKGVKQELLVGETNPCTVLVPPGVVHGYQCVSAVPALSINFPDKLYRGLNKGEEIDEIRWEERADSPYQLD